MNSATAHINNFPNEILLHIFSYLPTSDLVMCVTKVCARWNAVAHSRKLWLCREVCLPEDTSVQALFECFPKCQSVTIILNVTRPGKVLIYDKSLHAYIKTQECLLSFLTTIIKNGDTIIHISVYDVGNGLEEVLKLIAHLPNLQTLMMQESFAANSGIRHIADKCPHLKGVNTNEMTFSEKEIKYFLKKKKHQLTHIGFSVKMAKGPSLLPFLAICGDTLISLAIYGVTSSCIPTVSSVSVFRALKNMEHLRFYNCIKFRNGILAKAFTSGWLSNLRTLQMDSATDVDDKVVATICLNCPQLKDLSINSSEITGEGLKHLHCLRNLQNLDLSYNDILASLGTLSQCVQLQRLDLTDCLSVSPWEISEAVPCLRKLRYLDLTCCEVSTLYLPELPRHLPVLQTLFLCGTAFDEQQLEAMKLSAPHINVLP